MLDSKMLVPLYMSVTRGLVEKLIKYSKAPNRMWLSKPAKGSSSLSTWAELWFRDTNLISCLLLKIAYGS